MTYKIFNEDCIEGMKKIPDGSVDMILDDLPFGTTDLQQDTKLPLDEMWEQFLRVCKHNAAIVLFSQMPFGAELIQSQQKIFRYEWVYEKQLPVGFFNANKMPMRKHENILIFYRALPTYNAQMTWDKPYKKSETCGCTQNYQNCERLGTESDGRRYPVDVLKYRQPYCEGQGSWHPQEKPVDLLEYLIKTYTNEGETVLDATFGSGSTAVAAINTGRKFIGFERDKNFFSVAEKRIKEAVVQREQSLNLMRRMELKIIDKSPSELIPYENNPRNNDGAVEAVANSIAEFGFKNPIVIGTTGEIICGHTRLKAAQKLGLEKVPCVIADDLTEEEIKEFRIVDNKTGELADWSSKDLNAELATLSNFNMQEFGFDMKTIKVAEILSAELKEENPNSEETGKIGMSFLLHKEQANLIRKAMKSIGQFSESSLAIYEIIRQWTELRHENI